MDPVKAKLIELCGLEKIVAAEEEMGLKYEITLADVLRAIGKSEKDVGWKHAECTIPEWRIIYSDVCGMWNLTTDYDNQTQGTKDFIGSLIGVTN